MLTVHLRINDAATGKPTPARLRVLGPDGTYYAPFGRVAEFAWGRNEDVGGNLLVGSDRHTYIDGACEIRLPAGVPLRVQATKGPEFEPLDEGAYAEAGTPIPARVVRLIASPGQYVRRGQPLAELQSVELGQARAQRTAAQARADLARQTVERKRRLAEERIVSRGELQRAEADLAGAEADLRVLIPSMDLCTDNGAMIAVAGAWRLQRGDRSSLGIRADPSMELR